jgi:PST family polysaccharide transporter
VRPDRFPDTRRILRNTTVLTVAQALAQLANFILIVGFARTYGATALGHYSVAMAVAAVAGLFVNGGTNGLALREISRDPRVGREWVGVLLPIELCLAVGAWLVAAVASLFLIEDTGATAIVLTVCGYQVLLRPTSLLQTQLQAGERMSASASADLVHRAVSLTAGLTAMALRAPPAAVGLALVAGAASSLVVAWVAVGHYLGRPRLRFAPGAAWALFRRSSPFFGFAAMAVIHARAATLLVGLLTTTRSVAAYATADRLMVATWIGPNMFNAALQPVVTRIAGSCWSDAEGLAARGARLLSLCTIPLAALVMIFASDVVFLVFGRGYEEAVPVLRVLAWTLPLGSLRTLLAAEIVALDRQGTLARARALELVTFLLACALLILGFGPFGAAWAVLLGEALHLALCHAILKRERVAPPLVRSSWAPAVAALATVGVGSLLTEVDVATRVTVVLAFLGLAMWSTGAIRRGDLRYVRTLLRHVDAPRAR